MAYRNIYRATLLSVVALLLCFAAVAQQNGQFKKITVLDTVKLRGVAISHIVTDFSTQSHFNIPTAKAVWDLVAASAIDTIYISAGAGGDPDTICITGPLCAVLPPGLSAMEVAAQISDSLDWVRDTTQDLRVAITALEGDITAIEGTLAGVIDGSGTTGYVPKFSDANTLTNSLIQDDGTRVGIGTAPASPALLKVNGHLHLSGAVTRYLYFTDNTAVIFGYENGAWIANGGAGSTFGIRQNNATKFYMDANARFGIGAGVFTPGSLVDVQTSALGVTQTNTSGLLLSTSTAAASGAQQISPALRFRGFGWKSNATAASQPVDWRLYVLPVQGSTAAGGNFLLQSAVNDGAYTTHMTFSRPPDGSSSIVANIASDLQVSGRVFFGGAQTYLFPTTNGSSVNTGAAGLALGYFHGTDTPGYPYVWLGKPNASSNTNTSGTQTMVFVQGRFNPTSGTGLFNALELNNIINQTGGASGISRGLWVNPTLTAAADYRAVQIDNNSHFAVYQSGASAKNYFAGNVGIGTTTPDLTLDVRSSSANTTAVQSVANSTVTTPLKTFATNATPESAITGSPGDIAFSNAGAAYLKETGSATNTGWAKFSTSTDLAAIGTIYTANGSLTGSRTVDMQDFPLIFANEGGFAFNGNQNGGGVPVTGAGSRVMWVSDVSAFRVGLVAAGIWDNADMGYVSASVGGENNNALGDYGFTGGGQGNNATDIYSATVGGNNNTASGYASFVAGGEDNTASGNSAFVLGGQDNAASGFTSFILGGQNNIAPSLFETVLGGNASTYTVAGVSTYVSVDRLLTVGNGTGTGARSSALIVYKGGVGAAKTFVNPGTSTTVPDEALRVGGNVRIDDITNGDAVSAAGYNSDGVLTTLPQSFFNDYDALIELTSVTVTEDTIDADSNTKSNDFSFNGTTNTYTYNGPSGRYYKVSVSAQVESPNCCSKAYIKVYRNGTVTSAQAEGYHTDANSAVTLHGQTILILTNGDTLNAKFSGSEIAGEDYDILNYSFIISQI